MTARSDADRALAFNIWREARRAEMHDVDLTVADVAALLDEPENRVKRIVKRKGWAARFAPPQPQHRAGFGRISWEYET